MAGLEWLIKWLLPMGVTFAAVYSFSFLYTAPKGERCFCGIGGVISWFVETCGQLRGWHVIAAVGLAAFALGILSRVFAVWRRQPATVYLIPSIFPLVPGGAIYHCAYGFIAEDASRGLSYGLEAVETAMAIALGIILAMAVPLSALRKGRRLLEDR